MDGYVTIGTELDTKNFDKQITFLKNKLDDIEATLQMASEDKTLFSTNEIRDMEQEAEKLRNRLIDLQKKQSQIGKTDFSSIKSSLNSIGKSVESVTGKVIKWGLAVFGIRTAYNAVRSAISIISQNDEQLATDIEYMKNALAYALEPVVRAIVNLMKELMFYVAYIVKAWTGRNIFANANKSLKNTTGNARKLNKELEKTTFSFDKINKLNSNSSGGDTGGATTPSFDLSQASGEVPSWLQWIVDHKDEVVAGLAGIATALGLVKLGLDPLTSVGIGIALAGIVYSVEKLLDYLDDPTWENFGGIIQGIGITLLGLAILISGPAGIVIGIIGAIVLLYGTVIKYWDKIKEKIDKVLDWWTSKSDSVYEKWGEDIGYAYDKFFQILGDAVQGWDNTFTSMKEIFDETIKLVKSLIDKDWKEAWESAKNIVLNVFNTIKENLGLLGDAISSTFQLVGSLFGVKFRGGAGKKFANGGIILPKMASGGIVNMPGRGIDYYGANIAERGAEGIIPLTNEQSLETIGRTIAKYTNFSADITLELESRILAKVMKEINNENSFARNGG